ncbi:response regulator [Pseudoalteromonas luteoviolacea]|uniref:response regulator n=1 Tax=Pseudoalteromonas luteoviolacea TaxID=43657 RepID=UPI001B35CEB5|nr:response regulator [Pseudoalteromonas luteoviolacea]MBQ4834866.1 response regulator [Pseudoalteromonas luteoviolacea]
MKILYVENHKAFISAVKREFLSDHDVEVAPDINSAKAMFNDSYHLVLCDYDLDDGKGTEVVSYIRELSATVPIIAASSHERGNSLLIQAGANIICGKMDFRSLPNCIDRIINEI